MLCDMQGRGWPVNKQTMSSGRPPARCNNEPGAVCSVCSSDAQPKPEYSWVPVCVQMSAKKAGLQRLWKGE